MIKQLLITYFITISWIGICSAQSSDNRYTLWKPVPQSILREMETDRPDITESPITVDAGHFQFESDLLALHYEASDETKKRSLLLNNMNLKIGLAGSTSIQVGLETYSWEKTTDNHGMSHKYEQGIGELSLRIKQNLSGNNHGRFALALLPYLKLPTASYGQQHHYQGGLIIPMQLKVAKDWKIAGQLEVDRLDDLEGGGMHTELLQSLTVSHQLVKGLDGIAESYYTYDFKQHHISNFVNAALQIEVAKDIKVDGGFNYGIQKNARKRYFIGMSVRI